MARKSKVLSKSKKSKAAPKDFVKQKQKVGKKKQTAANDTKTDYKVKKVQMPAQHALEERGEEVTHRKLGLLELLAHMQHHSSKVRRDAFRGLHELCSAHDTVLRTNLARILDATTTAAMDNSAEVRSAFRHFQGWLVGALPQDSIAAFAPSLALQVRSALSHVSSEVREDGLQLLELYLTRLGSDKVLSQVEAARIVYTLCQLTSHAEAVLPCLYRLLNPAANSSTECTLSNDVLMADLPPQVPLQAVLDGRLEGVSDGGSGGDSLSPQEPEESAIWSFCLRAWLQAGELPKGVVSGGKAATEAAARPGRIRLRCAAVLERVLENSSRGARLGIAADFSASPSASQIAALSGLVRREEWPLKVDSGATFKALADTINLRFARVLLLLASGAAPPDTASAHLARLARAALAVLEDVGVAAARAAGGVSAALGLAAHLPDAASGVEVKPLLSAAATAHTLRSLDLLWAVVAGQREQILGHSDVARLVEVTSALASCSADEKQDSIPAAAAMAVPLTACLLGLRVGHGSNLPSAVTAAWPEVLASHQEPGLMQVLEQVQADAALAWVTTWPKMLWYLGGADPALSGFLLELLLELAKKAAEPGGAHCRIFSKVWPLLVPFLTGMPGSSSSADMPPPVTLLPADAGGPQELGAWLVHHFPRLSEALFSALCRLICRWSEAGGGGQKAEGSDTSGPMIGLSAAETLLEALLFGRMEAKDDLRTARHRVALEILRVRSAQASAQAELAALRLLTVVAGWLMGEDERVVDQELTHNERCRVQFQTKVWQLCRELMAEAPETRCRSLCLLFACSARLPFEPAGPPVAQDRAVALRAFLAELFTTLGRTPGAVAGQGLAESLLDFAGGNCFSSHSITQFGPDLGLRRILARMLVSVWFRAAPGYLGANAYELLVKLCSQQLLEGQSALDDLSAVATVLAEAIALRNARSFVTDSWGGDSLLLAEVLDPRMAKLGVNELREELAKVTMARTRPTEAAQAPGLAELAVMLSFM